MALLDHWRRVLRARRDRSVRWTAYCRPEAADTPQVFEIGIERITPDGRVLGNRVMSYIVIDEPFGLRESAMRDARDLAKRFNDMRVSM